MRFVSPSRLSPSVTVWPSKKLTTRLAHRSNSCRRDRETCSRRRGLHLRSCVGMRFAAALRHMEGHEGPRSETLTRRSSRPRSSILAGRTYYAERVTRRRRERGWHRHRHEPKVEQSMGAAEAPSDLRGRGYRRRHRGGLLFRWSPRDAPRLGRCFAPSEAHRRRPERDRNASRRRRRHRGRKRSRSPRPRATAGRVGRRGCARSGRVSVSTFPSRCELDGSRPWAYGRTASRVGRRLAAPSLAPGGPEGATSASALPRSPGCGLRRSARSPTFCRSSARSLAVRVSILRSLRKSSAD